MRLEHIKYLACPACFSDLSMVKMETQEKNYVVNGQLICLNCKNIYEIIDHIPRFVPTENYAASFGLEWNKHARTQYDSYNGTTISETRFFEETKWPRDLRGEIILEVGSGSGRFTEIAASTGAMVVSLDYSDAVEANYKSNGHKNNVLIVQADIYAMPFKSNLFDKVFCIGVLQHTPDVEKAFLALPKYLKSKGSLVIDVYRYRWWKYLIVTRYWVRPITKRLAPETLYRWCERYVNIMWPISRCISKLPKGEYINRVMLIADHRGRYPLSEDHLKEWSILDTFDGLSPTYDKPQSINTVIRWVETAGLKDVEIRTAKNRIEARGQKPT